MKKARVRVEAKKYSRDGRDQMRNLTKLIKEFRDECGEYKILQMYKDHQFYIRPGDKRRRKEAIKLRIQQQAALGIQPLQEERERNYY